MALHSIEGGYPEVFHDSEATRHLVLKSAGEAKLVHDAVDALPWGDKEEPEFSHLMDRTSEAQASLTSHPDVPHVISLNGSRVLITAIITASYSSSTGAEERQTLGTIYLRNHRFRS